MKATVKLYLNDGAKNDVFPVKLILTHQQKIKRKTIARASADDWDMRNQLPLPSHPDYEELYGTIMGIRAKAVTMAFKNMVDLSAGIDFFIKKEVAATNDFYVFADRQVKEMRRLGRNGNADAYQCAVDQLKKYAAVLKFEQITSFFLEGFKRQKKREGLKNTSIRTYLYEIRAIYNTAVRLGHCLDKRPFSGLFIDLQVRRRRHKNEYLDAGGLAKLAKGKGCTPEQRVSIDLSLLQFYLCGADLMDVYFLKRSQIVRNRVFLRRSKLGGKAYEFDVLLTEGAKTIIAKYGTGNDGYVFPWRKDDTGYKTFRSTHNQKLKRVQKNLGIELMPRGGKLTSKVIRHSFATLAKFERIDPDIIRELMGHERDDIDTVYKDKYPEKVRDRAHKKVVGLIR